MDYVIVAGLLLSHVAALVAGGYLHYRFGSATVSAAKAVAQAYEQK